MKELWVEKYRPKTLDGYVYQNDFQKKQVVTWVKEQSIPHLLFSGSAGIGKTTLAKILLNELDISEHDILEINASRTNSVDDVRDKIINFVQMIPFGSPFKVVLLDEADYLSPNAQAALRGVMEAYHTNARFILTCNYPNRIIPALHSRCQGFHFERPDQLEFFKRVEYVLLEEDIKFNDEVLANFVAAYYPDLRKTLNTVQQNIIDNKLESPATDSENSADYKLKMVELFKAGKINQARKLVCSQARPEEMEDIYRWLYDNISLFGDDIKQEKAVIVIKQGMVDHTLVSDPEINLAATMIRLAHINDQ
jgi:DNA polymerase III delta prime subunit